MSSQTTMLPNVGRSRNGCREFLKQLMSLERQSVLCMHGRSHGVQEEGSRLIAIEPWESLFSPLIEQRPDGTTDAEIVGFAERIRGCYSEPCLVRLLEVAKAVPPGGAVCEIGVWYGRSASVLLLEQYARLTGTAMVSPSPLQAFETQEEGGRGVDRLRHGPCEVHLVDSWEDEDARVPCERLVAELVKDTKLDVRCHWMPSERAAASIPDLDLLHIDGGHGEQAAVDCRLYLPKVRVGGIAVFHDYGDAGSFPAVTAAVDAMVVSHPQTWTVLSVVENQLTAKRVGLD